MKQMKKIKRGWKFLSTLSAVGLLAVTMGNVSAHAAGVGINVRSVIGPSDVRARKMVAPSDTKAHGVVGPSDTRTRGIAHPPAAPNRNGVKHIRPLSVHHQSAARNRVPIGNDHVTLPNQTSTGRRPDRRTIGNSTAPATVLRPGSVPAGSASLRIRASGVAADSTDPRAHGCSLVGDKRVFFASGNFLTQIRTGYLGMQGFVPGTRSDYEYYLVMKLGSAPYCRAASGTSIPKDMVAMASGGSVVDKPEITGDGEVRLPTAHVSVPQDARIVLDYYMRLYAVGTSSGFGGRQLQVVCSNMVEVQVLPAGSRCQ